MSSSCSDTKHLDSLTPEQLFVSFSNLTSQNVEPCCEHILAHYHAINRKLGLTGLSGFSYYNKLKENINNNLRAKAIWEILDRKAANSVYNQQRNCKKYRIVIVGAGPIGLRMAIEGSLLGAEVHVIEKRTSFTRNNVAHLWHFTIEDFKMLGIKKLFGGFCAGNINHISIRRTQCVLLQVSLILGVQLHAPLEYLDVYEPDDEGKHKWRLKLDQADHLVANLDFDFIVAADGARTKFRTVIDHNIKPGKLCIGITANFVNTRSQKEMEVQSIAGVAAIYDQQFFRSLKSEKGIELENIVYYKDDTHYFVMTARTKNLLAKKVLKSDGKELGDLCRKENVDYFMLINYVREVNDFATGLDLDFYTKKDGRCDVSLFDFSRRAVSTNACRMFQKHGATLTVLLVGDSLIEPFWPLGTGLALGVLTVLDTAWFIKGFADGILNPLELIAQRECLFKLLNSEFNSNNLLKPFSKYTIDPTTRYPNFQLPTKISSDLQHRHRHLFSKYSGTKWQGIHTANVKPLNSEPINVVRSTTPPLKPQSVQDELKSEIKTQPLLKKTTNKGDDEMRNWFKEMLSHSQIPINKSDFYATFKDGNAFAFIISRFRPDLLDLKEVKEISSLDRLKRVFKIADENFGIAPICSASKFLFHPDQLEIFSYLMSWYNYFKHESTNNHKNTLSRIYNKFTFKRKHGGTKRESKVRGDAASLFAKGQEQQDNLCRKCNQFIYITEKVSAEGYFFHRKCFTCEFSECNTQLTSNNCSVYHNEDGTVTFLCPYHFHSIESADFAAGCQTLKHVKNLPHLTTEQIASKASQARDRAFTVDTPQTPDSPVKTVHPIISNQDRKHRTISQPLIDSPTQLQKSIADSIQTDRSIPVEFIPSKTVPAKTAPSKTVPAITTQAKTVIDKIPKVENKPVKTLVKQQTDETQANKQSNYENRTKELTDLVKNSPTKTIPTITPHPYRKHSEPVLSESPILPRARIYRGIEERVAPKREKRIQSTVDPPTLEKLVQLEQAEEAISARSQTQANLKYQRKSSYEPRFDSPSLRLHPEQTLTPDETAPKLPTRPSVSNYPNHKHKTSMTDLYTDREETADDIGPNPQVFHRYNIFKAQSSDCLLRGSFNSTNAHFNPRAATKQKRFSTYQPVVVEHATLLDRRNRLSQVKETIENHPHKARNSIEIKALKAEQSSLEEEIDRAMADNNSNDRDSNNPIIITQVVQQIQVTPDICQHLSIAPESVSSVPLEEDTPVEMRDRITRTATQSTDQLLPVSRGRLSAYSGQSSLYRSKRYRSTRIISTQSPQRRTLDVPIDMSQSIGDEDDTHSDEVQAENQKEQDAFRRAMELDERMDVLNQKMGQLEEKGKYYEYKIRNTEDCNDEIMVHYLKDWSDIINLKNYLLREDRDLSLEFKELQLKDELYRVENELRRKQETDLNFQGVESKALLNEKMTIIQEMDDLVAQIDQERINEREEDEYRLSMLPLAIQSFTDGIMYDALFIENPKGHRSKYTKY